MEEWKIYKLGDLLQVKYGRDHKSLSDGPIPAFGSGGLMRMVEKSIYDKPSILIPRKGSLNNILFVDRPFWTVDTMFWTIINTDIVIPHYLHYAIKDIDFASLNVGSAVPSLTVPIIEAIEVSIPDIYTQRRILDCLEPIDNKIALNTRINHNLEEQMTSLFDELCVDIDDCIKAPLTEIADYVNGLAMQKFPATGGEKGLPVLKIKELGQGFCDESSDRCTSELKPDAIIHDGDIVFSWSGTLLVDMWCGGICGINQHLFKVQSNKYPKWFYYMWTKYHLEGFIHIAKDKAVTMGHIKRGHLENAIVNIPSSEALVALNKIFEPMLEQILKIRLENRKLRKERDLLLPRLMSGNLNC